MDQLPDKDRLRSFYSIKKDNGIFKLLITKILRKFPKSNLKRLIKNINTQKTCQKTKGDIFRLNNFEKIIIEDLQN